MNNARRPAAQTGAGQPERRARAPASDGPKSPTGQARRALHASVWERIRKAHDDQYWLEVITLCESIITDRLEARLEKEGGRSHASRRLRTAGQAAKALERHPIDDDERALLERVRAWSDKRNRALHELAKLVDGEPASWTERLGEARKAADEGRRLAREVSALVRRKNKPRPAR